MQLRQLVTDPGERLADSSVIIGRVLCGVWDGAAFQIQFETRPGQKKNQLGICKYLPLSTAGDFVSACTACTRAQNRLVFKGQTEWVVHAGRAAASPPWGRGTQRPGSSPLTMGLVHAATHPNALIIMGFR